MKHITKLFIEADKVADTRYRLRKGVKLVFGSESRGRIGWDLYKSTLEFRRINLALFHFAESEVSDAELEQFLLTQIPT